jgi:hypothetical protein
MKSKPHQASWWVAVAILSGMLLVMFFEAINPDLLPVEPGIEMFTVILGFTLLALWVHVNSDTLQEEDSTPYEIQVIESASSLHLNNR